MKHAVEVLLVVVSPSLQSRGQHRFLLVQSDDTLGLPCASLNEQQTSLEVAGHLLYDLTGLKAKIGMLGWADLVPCPIADDVARVIDGERVVGIPYACMVPEMIQPRFDRARWVGIDELFQSKLYMDHMQILQVAARRV